MEKADIPITLLKGVQITAVLDRVAREGLDESLLVAEPPALGAAPSSSGRRAGSIAVLPIHGTIFPRANLMTEISGGASAEVLARQVRALASADDVEAIVLDVDSPGGLTAGIPELAREVSEARERKPVIAVANHLAASAAYWVSAAATEIVATPSATVGSIGVYLEHLDFSKQLDDAGIKVTLVSAGRLKTRNLCGFGEG